MDFMCGCYFCGRVYKDMQMFTKLHLGCQGWESIKTVTFGQVTEHQREDALAEAAKRPKKLHNYFSVQGFAKAVRGRYEVILFQDDDWTPSKPMKMPPEYTYPGMENNPVTFWDWIYPVPEEEMWLSSIRTPEDALEVMQWSKRQIGNPTFTEELAIEPSPGEHTNTFKAKQGHASNRKRMYEQSNEGRDADNRKKAARQSLFFNGQPIFPTTPFERTTPPTAAPGTSATSATSSTTPPAAARAAYTSATSGTSGTFATAPAPATPNPVAATPDLSAKPAARVTPATKANSANLKPPPTVASPPKHQSSLGTSSDDTKFASNNVAASVFHSRLTRHYPYNDGPYYPPMGGNEATGGMAPFGTGTKAPAIGGVNAAANEHANANDNNNDNANDNANHYSDEESDDESDDESAYMPEPVTKSEETKNESKETVKENNKSWHSWFMGK